jgi:hypothetical protein
LLDTTAAANKTEWKRQRPLFKIMSHLNNRPSKAHAEQMNGALVKVSQADADKKAALAIWQDFRRGITATATSYQDVARLLEEAVKRCATEIKTESIRTMAISKLGEMAAKLSEFTVEEDPEDE